MEFNTEINNQIETTNKIDKINEIVLDNKNNQPLDHFNNHFKKRIYDDIYDDTTVTTTTTTDSLVFNEYSCRDQPKKKKKRNNKKNNNNKNENKKIDNQDNNKNNNNKNPLSKKNIIKNYAIYKLFSPFHKMLSLKRVPSLDDLYTEFYHLLEMENCQQLQDEIEICRSNKKANKQEIMMKPLAHFHSEADIDRLSFRDDRTRIETIVRKICGFLQKETNMVLVELILMSIGISKSISLLKLALDIEDKGGIIIKVKQDDNNTTSNNNSNSNNSNSNNTNDSEAIMIDTTQRYISPFTSMSLDTSSTILDTTESPTTLTRRKTIGGIFFKLSMMIIPEEMRRKVFSLNVLLRYKRERYNKGKGHFTEITKFKDLPSVDSIIFSNEINELDEEFEKMLNLNE